MPKNTFVNKINHNYYICRIELITHLKLLKHKSIYLVNCKVLEVHKENIKNSQLSLDDYLHIGTILDNLDNFSKFNFFLIFINAICTH